jgi:hypothetical protein
MKKCVRFNVEENRVYEMYSCDEYDRLCNNEIDEMYETMDEMYVWLDIYKICEMRVNKESVKNNQYNNKGILRYKSVIRVLYNVGLKCCMMWLIKKMKNK